MDGCLREGFSTGVLTDAADSALVDSNPEAAIDTDGPKDGASVDTAVDRSDLGAETIKDSPGVHLSQQLAIAHNLDDGEIVFGWGDQWFPDGEWGSGKIYMGYFTTDGVPVWGYFRFALLAAIPQGSTVSNAHLTLRGKATHKWQSDRDSLLIAADQRADAPQVASENDQPGGATGTTLTQSSVRWPAVGPLVWDTARDNRSPDLAPILQELVDNGGLAKGAHIQFWILNPDVGVDAEVAAEDFSIASATATQARIEINWVRQ